MIIFYKFGFFFGGIVPLLLGIFIYLQNRNQGINRTYVGLSLACATWSLGFFALISSSTDEIAYFWRMVMDIGAVILPAFWIHFVFTALDLNQFKKLEIAIYYAFGFFLILLNFADYFFRGLFILGFHAINVFNYYPQASFGYYLFLLFYIYIVPYSLFYLIREYVHMTGTEARKIGFLIIASFLGFLGGGTAFFLTFNIPIPPLGIILFAFYPITVAYAITKTGLFNIKVVTTQFIVSVLSVFILVRAIISESITEQTINGILFVAVSIIGIFLVKSVNREVEQRERIEKLAGDLEKVNARLEAANVRLKELDTLKSEFVSIATHQIRTPLTAIKGYASLILEGDYGKYPEKLNDPIDKILKSAGNLVAIVEDFLNISRIELGKMKYDFSLTGLSEMVETVADSFRNSIENKGLSFEVAVEPGIKANVDGVKMRQVFSNLIDNSSKYTPAGGIVVSFKKTGNIARFFVKDTGVGMSEDTKEKLFQKFSRATDANKTNETGAGLGLYVASEMVKAHHGKIWAESDGLGKGSTFIVEIECIG